MTEETTRRKIYQLERQVKSLRELVYDLQNIVTLLSNKLNNDSK